MIGQSYLNADQQNSDGFFDTTIRTNAAGDAVYAADLTCVETDDGADETASDLVEPPMGAVFFYLIRGENACGVGSLGDAYPAGPRPAAGGTPGRKVTVPSFA